MQDGRIRRYAAGLRAAPFALGLTPVATSTSIGKVAPFVAGKKVSPAEAVQTVTTFPASEKVASSIPDEDVVLGRPGDVLDPAQTIIPFAAGAAPVQPDDNPCPTLAEHEQLIDAAAPVQKIVPYVAEEAVVAGVAVDAVVTQAA
jgi:hypothetical protein